MAAATDFSDLLADLTAHPAVTGTLLFLNPVQRAPRPATALLHGPDVAVFDQDPKKDDDAARAWWDHLFPWTQTGSTPTNPSSLSFPVAGSPMVFHTIQLELSWFLAVSKCRSRYLFVANAPVALLVVLWVACPHVGQERDGCLWKGPDHHGALTVALRVTRELSSFYLNATRSFRLRCR